jgi:hypothetical protein
MNALKYQETQTTMWCRANLVIWRQKPKNRTLRLSSCIQAPDKLTNGVPLKWAITLLMGYDGSVMFSTDLFANLPARFARAADAALQKILGQPDVLGVLLAGSVAQGIADQHSDLDFYVVTSGKQRWRGCWILEQTPVEYFFNPAEFLHTTIQNDVSALHILASGIVVVAHPELEKLQAIARAALSAPRPTTPEELEFDRFNTIECVLETRSAFGTSAYGYILPQAVVFILGAIYRKNGWYSVRAKSVLTDLGQRAPQLAELATRALGDSSPELKQAALESLAKAVLDPLELHDYQSAKQTVLE